MSMNWIYLRKTQTQHGGAWQDTYSSTTAPTAVLQYLQYPNTSYDTSSLGEPEYIPDYDTLMVPGYIAYTRASHY